MSSGGKKRTRTQRVAALGVAPGRLERALESFGRRNFLIRVGLAVAAAVAMCLAIRSWEPPFSYREDFSPLRDIDARYSFEVVDPVATELARRRARQQAKSVFSNDPEPLVQLQASLHATLLEIAAHDYANLDASVWQEFSSPADKAENQPDKAKAKEEFEKFKKEVSGEKQLARIDAAVAAALDPYKKSGLLEKKPSETGNQEEILVYPRGKPTEMKTVQLSSVMIGNGTLLRDALVRDIGLPGVADRIFAWIRPRLKSTLTLDPELTQASRNTAADAVEPQAKTYDVGQILVPAGEQIEPQQMELLRDEYKAMLGILSPATKIYRTVAILSVILFLFSLCGLYLYRRERRLLADLKQFSFMLVLLVLTTLLARWAAVDRWRAELLPVLLFGQITAIAYRQELALLLSGMLSMILVMGLGLGLDEFIVLFGVTATAILQVSHIRSRSKLIFIGLFSGMVAVVITVGMGLATNQPLRLSLLEEGARNGAWTLAAGFMMTGLLPFVEKIFGVLTDMSLLELGDVAHPLLQELVRRAPSTYNHSITVGSIAEAAADAIGARGLLVRVGSYYHDIGKMLKPGYFIENQGTDEENRLETLVPAMSTLVIIAHIKDGAKLARQHHLPEPIIDFIQQHHGTTLVGYFYERASRQSQNDPHGTIVDESSFRYPGPKPQTKEAAVMMLADAVESASRTLVDPTPARIEGLVRQISERRLEDGQFDESGLTLRELRTIEKSMVKSVAAIYHGRVKYPEQKSSNGHDRKTENGKHKAESGNGSKNGDATKGRKDENGGKAENGVKETKA